MSGPLIFGPNAASIQQPLTGHFYASDGAIINRIADRLLLGDATRQDGNSGTTGKSWLGQSSGGVGNYFDTTSILEVASIQGTNVAGAFGARTSDYDVSDGTFAITAYGLNDNPTTDSNAWGIYSSSLRETAHSIYTASIETDTTSLLPVVRASAYNVVPFGVTIGYSVAAGGEAGLAASGLTCYPSSVGIAFFTAGTGPNTANPLAGTGTIWQKGIVFQQNSLIGTDGTNGTWAIAMELAAKHSITWANNTGITDIGGQIRSDNTSGHQALQQRVVFGNSRLQIQGVRADLVTEQTLFEVAANPNSPGNVVNHVLSIPNSTTNPPILIADGSDTNIDLQLATKGTGCLWLGTGGVNAAVPANFTANQAIRVKDGTGATYYIPCRPTLW